MASEEKTKAGNDGAEAGLIEELATRSDSGARTVGERLRLY
jgi:hypothetical protein